MLNKIIILLSVLFLLSNCSPLAIFGGGLAAGTTIVQERSVGDAIDDATIWTKIKNAFLNAKDSNHYLLSRIGVKVNEGRVLLTGTVDEPQARLKALKVVWNIKGVREVINEIRLEDKDGHKFGFKAYMKDSWVTTQIKGKLLVNGNIKSVNYSIDTIDQVVYLIGIAQNEQELDLVTQISGTIKGVKKVVSYVRIKDSKVREEMLSKY